VSSGLLATKLHRPATPPRRVRRSHLTQRLHEGLASGRQITLVSAPAGFGKTTCISEWVDALDFPTTWLSLDPGDDDPRRFFGYLVAALQKVDARLGRDLEGALRSGQLPPCEVVSTTFINDILELEDGAKGRFLLVMDDFQVIQDRFIVQVMEQLVANLPPPLHLVLITREDPSLPLARLRANNQLTEIRARDLRFTRDDAERFLNEVMTLFLSQADIATLEDKTEGWVVGLQLAALALQACTGPQSPSSVLDQGKPSNFIATLSGSHRFILSYLTEEVLGQQPEEIQRFLLQTSILDKLNGDLCNAVTGRSDGRALLERLFKANLFLTPLDDEGQWYRYHHLFADLLRDLQNARQKDETAELHRRASQWYAQTGGEGGYQRGAFAGEAIQHALAAEDYAMAVDLLEHHASGMIMQGYAKTVNGWVQAIPAEWASSSPRTHLAFAWMHLLRGAYDQVSPYLERAQAAFGESQADLEMGEEKRSLKAEWLAMQSLMLYMQGQAAEGKALAAQALEIVPQQDSRVQSLAYYALASACWLMEDYPRAVEAYQMAIQHGRAAGNLVAEMMSTVGLSLMAFERGQLHLASEIAAPEIIRIEQSGSQPPVSGVLYGLLGEVYYQWLQIENAQNHSLRALQLSTLGGYNTGAISCRVLLSRLSQIQGDLETATREIQQAVALVPLEVPGYVQQELVAQQVRVYLAQNRPAAAQMALQGQGFSFQGAFSYPALSPGQSMPYSLGLLYNSSLHVLLYQARAGRDLASLRSGVELAGRLIAGALQGQTILVALEALLLRAQMYAAVAGDQANPAAHLAASQADYVRALELAEPEGFIGVFVNQGPHVAEALATLAKQNRLGTVQPGYVERILAAFWRSQPRGATRGEPLAPYVPAGTEPVPHIEPLTDRELDVLRLMAEGLKYKEIAARLFISLNTVRFHVKAIYGKLSVNNRTQAIEMARQLQIL
jgi:LuxR family maltose regulon positive regulatory protein